MLETALDLARRGFAIVPQLPGAKQPCIRWKPFQNVAPVPSRVKTWFEEFPGAGIALILGPASGLFVVDVDGPDAHQALLDRLGAVPEAPTVLSGSAEPHKYHLYFKDPDVPTLAKFCPWHPQLEFRGYRGIIIAPPSLHKSGRRYLWAEGRSLDDLPLPEVPRPILDALTAGRESREERALITSNKNREGTLVTPGGAGDRARVAEQAREVALAEQALRYLGPGYFDDYGLWVRVGMALSQLGDDGLDLWRAWSAQSECKYDPDVLEAKWASFGRDAGSLSTKTVGLGTLFYMAMAEGWGGPSRSAGRFRPAGFTIELPWLAPEQPRRTP